MGRPIPGFPPARRKAGSRSPWATVRSPAFAGYQSAFESHLNGYKYTSAV